MSISIIHGDHLLEAKGDLTLRGQSVTIDGALAFSNATLSDLTVTGTLTTSSIAHNGSRIGVLTEGYGALISSTSGNIEVETTFAGNIRLRTTTLGNIELDSNYQVLVDAASRIELASGGSVSFSANSGNMLTTMSNAGIFMISKFETGSEFELQPYDKVRIEAKNDTSGANSHIFEVANTWDNAEADGISVVLEPSSLSSSNVFLRMCHSGSPTSIAGRIRGAASNSEVAFKADSSNAGGNVNSTQDVVYASGSSDFGEWVECGDYTEWDISEEKIEKITSDYPSLGIPEGTICYVRDGKFYRHSPGTPMVVTNRALIVGNERIRENYFGEILSFVGQVPVMVCGKVSSGDLIIPNGNHGKAVSPENVTFLEYRKAIGTAWKSKDSMGVAPVLVAIGITNTL